MSFSLDFIALNFSSPLRTVYRYRLENFDDKWITTGLDEGAGVQHVSYTNLPPNRYRFVVSASTGGEQFGEEAVVEILVLPGISAFQKAASLLGAPIGHDFCIISLSDLMTSWEIIEKRITAAATADFVTAIYNPKSEGRYWQLYRLKEIFQESRSPETPVGYVRQAGREEETVVVTTLQDFDPEEVDMFTVILIGNSQTYQFQNRMVTPRGYYREQEKGEVGKGQEIMMNSFRKIEEEMQNKEIDLDRKWALFHAIHTTCLLYTSPSPRDTR